MLFVKSKFKWTLYGFVILACIVAVWRLVSLYMSSNLPKKVMKSFGKEGLEVGLEYINAHINQQDTVSVEVYYESLCPDSRYFFVSELLPSIKKLQDIIDLALVPYGKATTFNYNGKLQFNCQHGERECAGNKVHACAVKHNEKDAVGFVEYLTCMIKEIFTGSDALFAGEKCAKEHKAQWSLIEECYFNGEGDVLLQKMGVFTHELRPPVEFIPTIVVNKSQAYQKEALRDLSTVVCKLYKGPEVPGCR